MSAAKLRVLESFKRPRATTNPYISMLADSLTKVCQLDTFTWKRAVLGRYDVFHVHWPEVLLTSDRLTRRVARRACFSAMLANFRIRRTAIVRTAHNLAPHERWGRIDSWLLERLDRQTIAWIRLNPTTDLPTGALTATILHGHYIDWFAEFPRRDAVAGQLTFFGLIRPYKGVPELVELFGALDDPTARLAVLGKPNSPELATTITDLARPDTRVTLNLRHIDDDDLVAAVTATSVVVLPYREMHNSGAMLVALSLGRRVLAPRTHVNELLADEVGPDWLLLYDGELGIDDLTNALTSAPPTTGSPDLSARNWDDAAQAHLAIFEAAVNAAHHK